MAFDPTNAILDEEEQPAAAGLGLKRKPFNPANAVEDADAQQGIGGTLWQGTKSAARAIGATANTYSGNGDAVVEKAQAQQQAPKDYRLENFYADVQRNKEDDAEDAGLWDGIKNVGGAIIDNPAGAGLAIVEQLPNAAPTLAGGLAGFKGGSLAGGAIGSAVLPGPGTAAGAVVGGVIGGLTGMFIGNTAIETGHKAMAAADDGQFTADEMGQVKREGAIKGGVITAIDGLTLGLGGKVAGAMQRTVTMAMETATRKVLVDRGIDVADEAAVLAARQSPEISAAVRAAQNGAIKATDTLKRRATEAGTLLGMESVGEGLGEYLGELAATGEADITDAVMEAALSLGQSGAEAAWNMSRKRADRGQWEPAKIQPMPTAENPNPAPIDRPDPNAGSLSRAANLLPGPSTQGEVFVDGSGNASTNRPAWVNPDNDPNAQSFGPGMDQQSARGEPALQGDYIPRSKFAKKPGLRAGAVDVADAAFPALTDQRERVFFADEQGNTTQGRTPNVPPRDYVQGGRGMDQQFAGKTYSNVMAAKNAISKTEQPGALEVVKVGPKQFEVRPTAEAQEQTKPVLQNRDRSTPASITQMRGIAARPDYQRVSVSRDFANGAPVVEPGASIPASRKGRAEVVSTASGRKISTQYAVIEAADLLPSHDINGSQNAGYENGAPGKSRAIAGNGRVTGISHAYTQGTAGEYRRELEADAGGHGISPAAIKGMKNPVLVRIMPQDQITQDIGDESNTATVSALSAGEQARNDSKRIDSASMAFDESGEISEGTVRQFILAMPEAERGALLDGGRPSRQAYERAASAVFASAYESDELIRLQAQASAPEARIVLAGLLAAASKMARLKGQGQWDIRGLVVEAAQAAVNATRNGQTLADYAQQLDIERTPEATYFIDLFARNSRSGKRIGEELSAIADTFYAEASKPETDMFGAIQRRSRQELLGESNGTAEGQPGSAQPTGQQAGPGAIEASRPAAAVDDSEQAGAGADAQAETFQLNQQTEEELAAADAANTARIKAEEKAKAEADEKRRKAEEQAQIKAQSEAQADNFALGANAEDSLSGQGGMFDSQPSLTELGGKPATQNDASDNADGPVQPAAAVKWFGTQNKAYAYLKGKKLQATHEVVAVSVSRFEIREKAKPVPVAPAAKPAAPAPEKPAVSSNTIFTDEAADEARAFIKSMLNGSQLNSGVDPRLFQAGITLAGYHIEKGARTFVAFARAMLADMGDGVRPYLKQWYMGVKYDPRASNLEGMSSAAMVDAFNLADIAAEVASPAPAPAPAPVAEQAQSLVDSFYALIRNDRMPKDNRELRKLVAEFDGKEADNARLKEAQEDLEAAIARYARDVAKRNMSDQATFSHLLGLYQQQPNLNVRTSSSIENQAYSTPAPLAYLAARLADIDRSTTVYEPTAGNGMLLMTADPKKATANELNDQRYNNLRALGFDAMQGDAMQVIESGALAPKSQDAIITNPPFGSIKDSAGNPTKISVDGYKIGQIDHLIAAEALKAMKDKGKATLILGANKVPGGVSTDDRIFFNWLYSHYNVTGHFELAGDLYNRQGAGWPVRVITINGRSSSANISPKQGVTQRVNTWEEVYEQYEQVLGAQLAKPPVAAGSGKPSAPTDDAATASQPDAVKTEAPDSGSRPGAGAGSTGNVSGTPAGNGGNSSNSKPGTLGGSDTVQRPDAAAPKPDQLEPEASPGRPDDGRRTAEGTKPGKPAGNPVSTGENAFQAQYVPRASRKDDGVLIPVNMAQPMQDALSSLEDAVGDIDQFVMAELGYASQDELDDALMGLQVDSVAAAIYQMKQGKGIVIADQTGIGKGRQAAAIIRWAERSGKTPVFVTMKDSLFSDMHGDLLDIGTDHITPLLMNIDAFVKTEAGEKLFANQANKHRKALDTIAATAKLPKGNKALFLTYSQINKPNTQRRVLTALAPNAIFILDESHNAGGASATGEFMRELLIDAAGVTYLSATYAKRPDNMPLYFKTDIGSAISDSGNLMDAMAQGGLPLQTVVSNNLVKAGQMFRRERSYDGVSIETEVDTGSRKAHEAMSDAATSALRAIVKADKAFHEGYVKALQDELEAEGGALDDVAGNQASESVDHTEFSSVVHNFIRQMLLGIKADTAADRAIEALKRGEKPLIALENTMGSFLNEYAETNGIKTGDSLGEFDYRTVLSRALERSRAVKKKDAMGNEEVVQIPLGELDFITRAAYDDAQQLIDGLKIDIPVSPLDWIRHRIEQAGYSVAEITGRNRTVDYSKARPVLSMLPSAEQNDKVGTTQRFNSGTLDAIILNVSGSTGISLHASEKFKDQRKRLMIVAQPAQDINVFMQMLGRVHRTGQVQVPAYLILNADLPAEKRPTALLNGKMQSLNANTSSNTESATSIKSQDMLNKYGDQVINAYLHDNIQLAVDLGVTLGSEGDAPDGLARKVTGRMALMPVADQLTFYAEIEEQYSSLIEYLNDSNQNELLPRTFDFEAELTKEATLVEATDEKTPFGQEAVYGEYKIKAQGKQMTPAEIRAEMDKNLGGVDGAAHAKALIASLKQQWADTINQERRENGLGEKFDRAKYHAWLSKRITDPAYAQSLVDKAQQAYDAGIPVKEYTPDEMSTQPEQLSLIAQHRIGSTWRVDINGDLYNAVVINVRSSHKKSGNPFSASKLQIQLAVNGPLRTITVPGSQWSKIEVAPLYGLSIDNAFRDQVEGSQTAKIITGNLLAAYGEIMDAKGTIISFTKKDGSIDQGILLPKKFDFKQNTRGDFQFRSAKDVETFLTKSNDPTTARFGVASRDASVRLKPLLGGILIAVPKSKARGGKYFLNKELLGITGDFISEGNFMLTRVTGEKATKAIEWLMRKAPLYAMPSQVDEARSILGLPPTDGSVQSGRGSYNVGQADQQFVSEPTASEYGYETDLFGNPVQAGNRKARAAKAGKPKPQRDVQPGAGVPADTATPAGEYSVRTVIGSEVSRTLATDKINNFADLAQATQYLFRSAVERFDGIVTDKNGKPLAVVGSFKGGIDSASVYLGPTVAEAVRVPGAANIWFAHNHPSGESELSTADRRLYERLSDVFDGSGIEPRGLIAVGRGEYSATDYSSGSVPKDGHPIRVPAIEREQIGEPLPQVVASPQDARDIAGASYAASNSPGILLLNTKHAVIGWVPLAKAMIDGPLRHTGQLNAIYRAISESNAGAAILVHGGELNNRLVGASDAGSNIAAAIAKTEVRVLDVINVKTNQSRAEGGKQIVGNTLYRLTDTATKGIPLFSARAIAKKVMAATGLNATVVNTEADLPADLQAQIRRDKATGRVAGVYHNGTVYLVASKLRDTQHAISVMLHEAVGHGGVHSVLGDKLGTVMRAIYRDMPSAIRAELERRYAGQLAKLDTEAARQVLVAEEYVAHLAETDPQHSVINRLVALLRKFIRATFGDAAALKWSRNDLVQLLAEARVAARGNNNGPKGSSRYRATEAAQALAEPPDVSESNDAEFVASLKGDAATRSFANAMYQARGTESHFFKGWFGKSRMVDKQGQPIAFVHRSYGERDTFTDADLGKNTGTPTAALGHFLARKDVGNVERYGPVVEQFYIRMTKPKVITQAQFEAMGDWSLAQVQAYRKTLMEQGHDGLYIQGLAWPVVFEGKNIKARRNHGTFDESVSTRYNLKQAATAAFKKWFGDSKVVDANGEPLVVYHGTMASADFSDFRPLSHFGTADQANSIATGLRIYGQPEGQAKRVMPVYLSIQNPLRIKDSGAQHEALDLIEAVVDDLGLSHYEREKMLYDENDDRRSEAGVAAELIAALENRGYDGLVYSNSMEGDGDSYIAFHPEQIKSATGNNGEFDGNNADIRYSLNDARDLFDRATGPTPLDNNDPFAEENRRLREGDKTLWQKAKKVFARQFAPGGLLPEAVFNAKITRDSEFQAVEFDVRHLSSGLNKAVNADYGVDVDNLTAEQMKPLAEALTGKVDPTIPEATRVAIVAMRQYIDSLSGEYLDIIQGQIDALQEKAATYGPALKAANDARKALNAAIASDSDPAIMQALANKKAALAAQVKAKKAMDGLKGDAREQAKADYERAVKAHDQAKAALRASLSPELKAQAKAAEALRAKANAARSSSAEAKAEAALHDKISANLGAYVNRSYQAFDDPNWFKTVPTEVVNAARTYLARGYMEQGESAAEARRLADVTVNEMLKNGTAYDSMGAFIAEGKLGAKDLTVLIKRKEIAPEIRALLGEYMDPRLNFAKSATKMGRLVWNQRFLDRVLDFGMGTLFFEGKNRPADATTQIAGDQSETYAPLNGLWTFPEVAQAFQDALGKEQMSDLYRTVVRLNGMVKYGKTILSPTTAMRNWQSAMFFSLANGHFDLTQMKKSWAALREQVTQNATGDDLAYLRKLKQLGVVYDTPYAGEMMALLQDARMDELLSSKSGTGLKWLRKANQFAQGFYSFGDDFWKIIGYENEKASLIGAGIPEAEAEVMAAQRIRDTYPTYSMIGKAVQWLRRFPLAGTFVSFPSEIIRTSVNMFQLVQADLKSDNPKIRALGRKRALGMAMVSGGFYALAALTAAAAGVGDDEEEALRDLAAPWSKNSTFLYTGRDADGKLRYFDLSFLDPYGYWKRPLTAMMRDQPWEKAAVSGLSDLLSPFFGADITAGAIFEVLANKKPTGGQVFNPDAGSVDQLQDIANHMRKALQPGFVSNGERLWLAGSEARREGSGQPYVMHDELVSLLGWRAATLDTQTGLYYRSFDFTDGLSNAKKTLTRTLRSSNEVSEGDIKEAKASANAQYQQAFAEMGRLVRSAQAAGMSRAEVMQTLKLSGVGQRNIYALMGGRVPPIDIGMQAQTNAVRQAVVMRDREHGAEIARRFRLAREE